MTQFRKRLALADERSEAGVYRVGKGVASSAKMERNVA
jgi:hypothetical protein